MAILPVLLLACTPAVRRIPTPELPPAPRSEVPELARAAWLEAAVLRELGEPELAARALQAARTLDPGSPWLRLEAVRLAIATGELDRARTLLEGPGLEPAVAGELRAALLMRQGDLAGAEAALREVLSRAPERWSAWSELVGLLRAQGRDEEARAALATWVARPLVGADTLAARGLARLQVGDAAGAVDDLGAAVALDAEAAATLGALQEAATTASRYGSALGWMARAEASEPVLGARAALAATAGDPWAEAEALAALARLRPEDGALWSRLALLRAATGDAAGARQARARARALGVSTDPPALQPGAGASAADALVREGQAALSAGSEGLARAEHLARAAVDAAPGSVEAWRLLARVLRARGGLDEASYAETRAARAASIRRGR